MKSLIAHDASSITCRFYITHQTQETVLVQKSLGRKDFVEDELFLNSFIVKLIQLFGIIIIKD